jgi:menaquinone reductase, multiheme cytochrome c subunit
VLESTSFARDFEIATPTSRFVFPPWANYLLPALIVAGVGAGVYVPTLLGLGATPTATAVGYEPRQPVPYSHALHVGQLGLDCRYCHTTVDQAAFAALPPTQTCMNCHAAVKTDSPKLAPIRASYATGQPVPWKKVHDLPQYAYFNHAIHVNKGVGCVTCHGRVDKMETVRQVAPLSMAWCIECHREPEQHLRPREQVTSMTWSAEADAGKNQLELGRELKSQYHVRDATYLTGCYTCHR